MHCRLPQVEVKSLRYLSLVLVCLAACPSEQEAVVDSGVIDAGVAADIGLIDPPVEAGQQPLDAGATDAGLLDAGPADTWINPESPEGRGLALYER